MGAMSRVYVTSGAAGCWATIAVGAATPAAATTASPAHAAHFHFIVIVLSSES
jgi:hypothetical protein